MHNFIRLSRKTDVVGVKWHARASQIELAVSPVDSHPRTSIFHPNRNPNPNAIVRFGRVQGYAPRGLPSSQAGGKSGYHGYGPRRSRLQEAALQPVPVRRHPRHGTVPRPVVWDSTAHSPAPGGRRIQRCPKGCGHRETLSSRGHQGRLARPSPF